MDNAQNRKDEANPYDERDSYYFGYYDGVEDAITALGLMDEYKRYKKGAKQ